MRILCLLAFAIIGAATPSFAQEPTQPAAPPAVPAVPPAPWWLVQPRAENPRPTKWRFRLEASGALSRMDGNLEGHTVGATGSFIMRKGLVTNALQLKSTIQELGVHGVPPFKQVTNSLNNVLMYNFAGATQLIGGFVFERDDPKFVKHRNTFYGGIGQSLFNNHPKHKMLVIGAIGHEDEGFLVPGYENDGMIAYTTYAYAWQIKPTIGLRQTTEYAVSLDVAADYRLNGTIAADIALGRYLYLAPTFEIRYDNRTTPLAVKRDTTEMLAFRVVF